jgi:hypothetical protein
MYDAKCADQTETADESSLGIQNVTISNAYYDTVSRSFQSVAKKCTNKLDTIKLTPMPEETVKSEDIYKSVPLIDSQTNETICMVCIKYWHNKQSSLSNTMDSKTSKKQHPVSKSPDSNHSSSSLHSENFSNGSNSNSTTTQNIPIHSPIYFYISSSNQNFIQAFNQIIQ